MNVGLTFDQIKDVWLEADRMGYYSGTLVDIISAPDLVECWTALSALAALTSRIRLVPLVLANPYRNPVVLAKMAATLDVISHGRFELGVGVGGNAKDAASAGIPFPRTSVRCAALSEGLALIKRLWTEEAVTFSGRYYSAQDALCLPKPVQKPRPPILVGGHGERFVMKTVAEHADICNWEIDLQPPEYEKRKKILEERCREVGRPISEIELSHTFRAIVAESAQDAERAHLSAASARGLTMDEFRRRVPTPLVGTPDDCAAAIEKYRAMGVTYFFFQFLDRKSEAVFGERVLPLFKGRTP